MTPRKKIPLNRLVPNAVTLVGLCVGLNGIRFAMLENWPYAFLCVFIAGVMDGLDGRIARLLGGGSRFGAELDSLADLANFGITPAIVIYLYSLQDLHIVGWSVTLFFVICMTFRLARFNTLMDDESARLPDTFFMGLPAPMSGLFCLYPLVIDLTFETSRILSPFLVATLVVLTSLMTMSRIPTFSIKKVKISYRYSWLVLLLLGLLIVVFVSAPWVSLFVAGLVYLATIPLAIKKVGRGIFA